MTVSEKTLRILSAVIWYAGGIALMAKAGSLLLEARSLRPASDWPQMAIVTGVSIGSIKAGLLFRRVCAKNLARIAALRAARIWECYRLRFYFFLAIMIAGGAALSRMARGDFPFLIAVAVLDLSIGTALLGGGYVFWRRKAQGP